jgi:hypothetical protein
MSAVSWFSAGVHLVAAGMMLALGNYIAAWFAFLVFMYAGGIALLGAK